MMEHGHDETQTCWNIDVVEQGHGRAQTLWNKQAKEHGKTGKRRSLDTIEREPGGAWTPLFDGGAKVCHNLQRRPQTSQRSQF